MKIYSVSEFNQEINGLLGDITVCVQGEVSNFHIAQNRFVWFDLKDVNSYFSCFMMSFQLQQELSDGQEIKVIGTPGLFAKSGKFHFKVKEIELVGAGALKKELELLKKKLAKEGLFDVERKRRLPRFIERVGLITSKDAAAYTDVIKILKNRWAGLEIYFYPVAVQGQSTINDIVGAFNFLNDKNYNLDVIILTRGGGSMEDLWAFNTEEICRAVFGSKTPVVAAIGHERDATLVDEVGDLRASTPSNAAELVVPHKDDVLLQIENNLKEQKRLIIQSIDEKKQVIDNFASCFDNVLISWQEKITHNINLLKSYNPVAVLNRGYSITRKNNKIIKNIKELSKNDIIETQFSNGQIKSKIN
ncbi:MAG: exodeoxyribonuclease VII large subunit [Patescibacteria group bacterium]